MQHGAHRTIEIRRHAERHKPGTNLNARGVARATNASARDRAFALVVTSPLPRALQTAIAMGHGVDEEDWTMATMGGSLDDFPWEDGFAAMQHAIRTNPVAAGWATHQTAQMYYWRNRIGPDEAVLIVSHGGVAEAGIIGLLGDIDAAPLGASLDYCEGVRMQMDEDRVAHVELLRFDGTRERATSPLRVR